MTKKDSENQTLSDGGDAREDNPISRHKPRQHGIYIPCHFHTRHMLNYTHLLSNLRFSLKKYVNRSIEPDFELVIHLRQPLNSKL